MARTSARTAAAYLLRPRRRRHRPGPAPPGDAAATPYDEGHRRGHRTAGRSNRVRPAHPRGRRLRLRRGHRLRGRGAGPADAGRTPRLARGARPGGARLRPVPGPGRGPGGAATRPAGDGRPRHCLPCGHRRRESAWLDRAGHRPPPAGADPSTGRRHRRPEPARLRVPQQGHGWRGRGVLRAARTAPAVAGRRCGRGQRPRPRPPARPGRGRDRRRPRAAGCQQPCTGGGRPAPVADGAGMRRTEGVDRGRPARPGHAVGQRHRFRGRSPAQRRGTAGGHGGRHRVLAERRRHASAGHRRHPRCDQWRAPRGAAADDRTGRGGACDPRAGRPRPRRQPAAGAVPARSGLASRRGRAGCVEDEGPTSPPGHRLRAGRTRRRGAAWLGPLGARLPHPRCAGDGRCPPSRPDRALRWPRDGRRPQPAGGTPCRVRRGIPRLRDRTPYR